VESEWYEFELMKIMGHACLVALAEFLKGHLQARLCGDLQKSRSMSAVDKHLDFAVFLSVLFRGIRGLKKFLNDECEDFCGVHFGLCLQPLGREFPLSEGARELFERMAWEFRCENRGANGVSFLKRTEGFSRRA
jgi:hypothetical protein